MTGTDSFTNSERIRRAFAEAEREDAFWHEQYDHYLELYPDQFVAVARSDGRFVAAHQDLDALIEAITKEGLMVRDVWSRFMRAAPIRLAL